MTKRFKEHLVYENDKDKIFIYLCLEDINSNKFTVPLMTTISRLESKTVIGDLRDRFLESLYYDGCPSKRFEWFNTMDRAINEF